MTSKQALQENVINMLCEQVNLQAQLANTLENGLTKINELYEKNQPLANEYNLKIPNIAVYYENLRRIIDDLE